ncbi:MAG TPA: GntR family transcriptional regulator [Steroidobacteraceae bacterium]
MARDIPEAASAGGPVSLAADAPTPRYYQVYVAIQRWIREGVYVPAQRIPTEAELCRSFNVSRITVRRSLDELERDGWLSRQQGRGTFVTPDLRLPPLPVDWSHVLDSVSDFTHLTTACNLSVRYLQPDEATRAALHMSGEGKVQRVSHLRMLHQSPLGQVINWVPEDIARRVPPPSPTRAPTFALLEQAGIRIGDSHQEIGAGLASTKMAHLLGVPAGAPLVIIERVVFDSTGRGVERTLAHYRADRYRYRMALRRGSGRKQH